MRTCLFLLLAWVAAPLGAEVIDRLAVTLDSQVITQSEIIREIRLTAFLNGEPLNFGQQARRQAAGRLIEQTLIRREIELGRYVQPSPEEGGPMLEQIRARRFHDPADYRQSLKKYGIEESDLKAYLLWQLTLLQFIEVRFRPAVQVTDDEMRQYFAQHRAELEKRSATGGAIRLEDVRDQVHQALVDQLVDKQMDAWLAATRKRTRIVFHPEAFQ